MKKRGFTLSEVLITIGLLGVVASMTIPTIVGNYKNQAFATSIRKNMTEILEAIDLMMTEEGKNIIWQTSMVKNESANDFIESYLDYSEKCEKNNIDKCFASSYSSINGEQTMRIEKINANSTAYTLKNGSAIMMKPNAWVNGGDWTVRDSLTIYIDTNGKVGPNKGGRDMFKIPVHQRLNGGSFHFGNGGDCIKFANGASCYQELAENNWKMKY